MAAARHRENEMKWRIESNAYRKWRNGAASKRRHGNQ
jgi:hypothetical protein